MSPAMVKEDVLLLLMQANNSLDHDLWHRALAAAGEWLSENGLTGASEVHRRAAWIWAQLRIEETGPFPLEIDEDGTVRWIDDAGRVIEEIPPDVSLAERSRKEPPPPPPGRPATLQVTITVAPGDLGILIALALACARETTLTFMLPPIESLRPQDGSLWIQGPDRLAAADLIVDALVRLRIQVSRQDSEPA